MLVLHRSINSTVTRTLTDVSWYTVYTVVSDLRQSVLFCTKLRLEDGDGRNIRNVGNILHVPTPHLMVERTLVLCTLNCAGVGRCSVTSVPQEGPSVA